MRISDLSSDVCSSDLTPVAAPVRQNHGRPQARREALKPHLCHGCGPWLIIAKCRRKARIFGAFSAFLSPSLLILIVAGIASANRSEERRVGREGFRTFRSRWLPHHQKKTTTKK